MRVLILGGGGFLGRRLACELLRTGGLAGNILENLTLVDITYPEGVLNDARLEKVEGDFGEKALMRKLLLQRPDIIFHFAAIVSGEAEKNFELGMKLNFHATLNLLELCRLHNIHPRIVFASSCAVFGGDPSRVITDDTAPNPLSSYGTQKALVELLMNDYSRRGMVDAICLRLPTIAVRPGKPNAATSSFVSGIIREPLSGKRASYPVPLDTEVWIQSPRMIIQNFIYAAGLEGKMLGNQRVINLPGLTTSVKDLIHSLAELTNEEVIKLIDYKPDTFLQSIVLTWPARFDPERAIRLGFVCDTSSKELIRQYIEEEGIALP